MITIFSIHRMFGQQQRITLDSYADLFCFAFVFLSFEYNEVNFFKFVLYLFVCLNNQRDKKTFRVLHSKNKKNSEQQYALSLSLWRVTETK